jgi:hypothetical protein
VAFAAEGAHFLWGNEVSFCFGVHAVTASTAYSPAEEAHSALVCEREPVFTRSLLQCGGLVVHANWVVGHSTASRVFLSGRFIRRRYRGGFVIVTGQAQAGLDVNIACLAVKTLYLAVLSAVRIQVGACREAPVRLLGHCPAHLHMTAATELNAGRPPQETLQANVEVAWDF